MHGIGRVGFSLASFKFVVFYRRGFELSTQERGLDE